MEKNDINDCLWPVARTVWHELLLMHWIPKIKSNVRTRWPHHHSRVVSHHNTDHKAYNMNTNSHIYVGIQTFFADILNSLYNSATFVCIKYSAIVMSSTRLISIIYMSSGFCLFNTIWPTALSFQFFFLFFLYFGLIFLHFCFVLFCSVFFLA